MGGSFVGELGNDSVELVESDKLVGRGLLADVSAVEQLEELVIIDTVLDPLGNALELLEVNDSILVLVVEGENFLETFLGLGLAYAGADDFKELFEGDCFVLILESKNESEDEGVPLVKSQLLKDFADFGGVDGSATVLVEHSEGFLELIIVLLSKAVLP